MAEQPTIRDVVGWIVRHPIEVAAAIAVLASMFKAATTKKPPRTTAPPRPKDRADASELEERVRRNFEEMMRRRAGAPAATSSPAPPAPAPATKVASAPARTPRRPVAYDELVRPEPTSTEGPRPRVTVVRRTPEKKRRKHLEDAALAVAGTLQSAAATRHERRSRSLDLRGAALDRRLLRRTVVLREILDPPIALRP